MTNGDRIRNMTDKEIAVNLANLIDSNDSVCRHCEFHKNLYMCTTKDCIDGIIKWMEKEATDDAE